MKLLYRVLFFLFSIFYLPSFFLKGKHRDGFGERLGYVPDPVRKRLTGKKVIWLHAVSVGEVLLALRFLEQFRGKDPEAVFLLTVTTHAAREVALRAKKERDEVLYFPADFRGAVRRFVGVLRPQIVVIFETEIWPCLLWELSSKGIPVFLVNARISDKAFGAYRKIRFFMSGLLNLMQGIGAQDERMRRRFIELGALPEKVIVTGNLKYEVNPAEETAEPWVRAVRESAGDKEVFYFVAGSTHEGEEEILFRMLPSLLSQRPNLRMVVAPRHPGRFDSVLRKARVMGIGAQKISELLERRTDRSESTLILDKMGVLSGLYSMADLVFVGGSLVPVGGHNPAEPAHFGKPILFGPWMQNFKDMSEEFVRAGAGCRVSDAAELEIEILNLMKDAGRRNRIGSAARELVRRHQGSTEKNLCMILPIVKEAV